MLCGYKLTGLMLEYFLLKKLQNGNVTLNVLPSPNPYTAPCKSSTVGSNAASRLLIAYS
jgi:hypothetical protein